VLRVTSSLREGDRETLYTGKKLTNALRTTGADLFETSSEKSNAEKELSAHGVRGGGQTPASDEKRSGRESARS
jgi:hypothetical protein